MYDTLVEVVDNWNMVDGGGHDGRPQCSILYSRLWYTTGKTIGLGLDGIAVEWMWSYLTGRFQSLFVDGYLSPALAITCGVPRGSNVGPLLYILWTNDISDLVHHHQVSASRPAPHCHPCGGTVCYVDDSTYSLAWSDPAALPAALTDQYQIISR